MLKSATGASANVNQLSEYAASRNNATEAIKNDHAKPTESFPLGNSRFAVRGFAASKRRSMMRLKVIAAERAPNIATVIQRICRHAGKPSAARTAPRKAKGSANKVCSNFIIASVVFSFCQKDFIDSRFQIEISKSDAESKV